MTTSWRPHWTSWDAGCVEMMLQKKRLSVLIISSLGFILLPISLSGAPQTQALSFGFYGGWSLGLGYEFDWHNRPSRSDDYTPDFHLGASAQYNFSEVLGLQADVNYQHGKNDWTFTYPGFPYDEGTDNFSFFSADLNAVITFWRPRGTSLYLLAGGGLTSGDWEDFRGTYLNLDAGLGVKIRISRTHPNLGLNLAGTFVHLIDPDKYGDETADYLKFQAGIEF
jgi:hypothetical protein